jgi:hypothetical protein
MPSIQDVKTDRSDLLLSYITVTRRQRFLSRQIVGLDVRVSEIVARRNRRVIYSAHQNTPNVIHPLSICLVSQSMHALGIVTVTHLRQDVLSNLFDSFPGIINVALLCPGGANCQPDTEHFAKCRLCQCEVGTCQEIAVKCPVQSVYNLKLFRAAALRSWQKSEQRERERGRGHEFEDWRGADAFRERIVQRNALYRYMT